MAGPGLSTNLDATYADSGTDASVKLHQQQHDVVHAIVNLFDTANSAATGNVPIGNGTVFLARGLLSTDVPTITTNSQTASYTLVLADAGKLVEMNVAAGNNLTVPPNASVAFPTGTIITVRQYGAGTTTIVAGAGVTVNSRGQIKTLAGAYAEATLIKRATNEWNLAGDLA